MDSEQIEKALKKNATTARHFRGVYARDTLPRKPKRGFYVVNFDKTGESGSHWVCMQIGKSTNAYFDSYGGKPPPFTQRAFTKFLGQTKRLEKNTKQLQSDFSTTCGQWCIYYIWRSCNGWNMKNIISPLKSQTPLVNDHVMSYIVKKAFGTDGKVIDRPFLKKQICRQMNENIAEWK